MKHSPLSFCWHREAAKRYQCDKTLDKLVSPEIKGEERQRFMDALRKLINLTEPKK